MSTVAERDAERAAKRLKGEPTLPLSTELEGLPDDEQLRLIVDSARAVVAYAEARRRPPIEGAQLLATRAAAPPPSDLERRRRRFCPWCGATTRGAACPAHLGLEREFQQAASG